MAERVAAMAQRLRGAERSPPTMLIEGALSAAERAAIDTVPRGLFIQGQWRAAAGTLPVFDPATGELLCEVADTAPDDGRAALDAACAAQPDWAAEPAQRATPADPR
ncbi:aldehyde dehydrogenase family protein [Nocardia sp. R7R-8]|uniref:aldehyde dehydrogenase family protein n=1 Tax=Nocardia sp. R7R-8 TaxID=3459304 RepID=UPI00403D6E23